MDFRPIFAGICAASGCYAPVCMLKIRELTYAGWEVIPDEVSFWVWGLLVSGLLASVSFCLATRKVKE